MIDGSGLSRSDRTSPREVVTMLRAMDGDASFTGSLAIAGRTGTLSTGCAARARRTAAAPRPARCATSPRWPATARRARGGAVAFAFLMNYVSPYGARILQDRMASALARYRALDVDVAAWSGTYCCDSRGGRW